MKLLGLLLLALIAGCDSAPGMIDSAKLASKIPPKLAPKIPRVSDDHSTLRVKLDTVRDRVWVLGLEHVDIYDRRTNNLIRSIALPQWNVANMICEPDIAFDATGTAFISHNMEPKLWQIDSDSFELKEHMLRLLGRESLDIGFGSIAFARDGTLVGVASSGGSLWRIDIGSATAQVVRMNARVADECAME